MARLGTMVHHISQDWCTINSQFLIRYTVHKKLHSVRPWASEKTDTRLSAMIANNWAVLTTTSMLSQIPGRKLLGKSQSKTRAIPITTAINPLGGSVANLLPINFTLFNAWRFYSSREDLLGPSQGSLPRMLRSKRCRQLRQKCSPTRKTPKNEVVDN